MASAKKSKRSIDDIFNDLDNLGRRKPTIATFPVDRAPSADATEEAMSPLPRKLPRVELEVPSSGGDTPTSNTSCSASLARSSMQHALLSPIEGQASATRRGRPTSSQPTHDMDDSPAFASELTTRHRRAEEAADLMMYHVEQLRRVVSANRPAALIALIAHINEAGGIDAVFRMIRNSGLTRRFLEALFSDGNVSGLTMCPVYELAFLGFATVVLSLQSSNEAIPVKSILLRLLPVVAWDKKPAAVSAPATSSQNAQKPKSLAAAAQLKRTTLAAVSSDTATTQSVADLEALQRVIRDFGAAHGVSTECCSTVAEPQSRCTMVALDILTDVLLRHNHILSGESMRSVSPSIPPVGGDADEESFGSSPLASGDSGLLSMRSLSGLMETSAAVMFVECGGMAALASVLKRCCDASEGEAPAFGHSAAAELSRALKLGTVVTCDPDLAPAIRGGQMPRRVLADIGDMVKSCGCLLSGAVHPSSPDAKHDQTVVEEEALKMLLNVTSSLPEFVPRRCSYFLEGLCRWVIRWVVCLDEACSCQRYGSEVAVSEAGSLEIATLSVCLAVNLLQRGHNYAAAATLVELGQDLQFLSHASSAMMQLHQSQEAERNVVAGYLAMMLACISLCKSTTTSTCSDTTPTPAFDALSSDGVPPSTAALSMRVQVITAITRAFENGSSISPSTPSTPSSQTEMQPVPKWEQQLRSRPMKLVVAILQEFVLFQSQAGILTREVLVAMHGVVEALIADNHITVEEDSQ